MSCTQWTGVQQDADMDPVEKDPLAMWTDTLEQTIVRGTCQAPSVSCATLLWNWDLKLKTGSWNYMTMWDQPPSPEGLISRHSSVVMGNTYPLLRARTEILDLLALGWVCCHQARALGIHLLTFLLTSCLSTKATLLSPSLQFIKEQKILLPEIHQCSLPTGLLGSGVV